MQSINLKIRLLEHYIIIWLLKIKYHIIHCGLKKKYKQKSMLKMGEMELVTYVNTGVIPTPEKIRNINWIEEEFLFAN